MKINSVAQQDTIVKSNYGKERTEGQEAAKEQKKELGNSIQASELNLFQDSIADKKKKAMQDAMDLIKEQFESDGIVDETKAQYSLQIPGNMGRDGYDLEFRKDNQDRFWLHQSNGAVYLDEQAAPVLSLGQGSAVSTVQPDGYARWYRIGENAEGKTMAVQVPEDAGFWVYNAQGVLTASSVLWDDASAVLQAGGLAVFAGDPGAQFTLTYS